MRTQSPAATIKIQGALNSTPNQTFTLEFFSNAGCDPSGFGEGQAFIGTSQVTTDSIGNANFMASFPSPALAGGFITATATDVTGNTSEFSQCFHAQESPAVMALRKLIGQVEMADLPRATEKRLMAKLDAALAALLGGREKPARARLDAFIDKVETELDRNKLTRRQAREFTSAARGIIRKI